jgi:hypothetical protein
VVHVDPIKPPLKASGIKRLNLTYNVLLSNFAFKFNLRRYSKGVVLKERKLSGGGTRFFEAEAALNRRLKGSGGVAAFLGIAGANAFLVWKDEGRTTLDGWASHSFPHCLIMGKGAPVHLRHSAPWPHAQSQHKCKALLDGVLNGKPGGGLTKAMGKVQYHALRSMIPA